ncbi:HET-domain-containing protein, partial [Tothia fuscella]
MPVFSASQIPPTPYTARLLDQGQVEFGVCRYWIERCSTGHDGCRTPPPSNLPGLKVIDCQLMMLVRYPPRCHYITLSYVWGKQTSAARTVNVGDAFPERSCPRVIRDAIAVTKILGYRYLWIDRYCIDQNDAKDKESQLAIMDLIYETATLTLVAAAGEDDQHGLPGAGTQPIVYRESQPRVHIGDLTLVSTLPDVTFPIHRSRWVKRGWTYQEAMLSRRLLIFTPIQVYFIC